MNKAALRIFLFVLAVLYAGQDGYAQLSRLTLKNGSSYLGYISVQRPGRNITFHSYNATVYAEENVMEQSTDELVPFGQLADGWKKKAWSDHLLVYVDDCIGVKLSAVAVDGIVHRQVKIMERGKVMKYVQYCEDDYDLSWSDIQSIVKENDSSRPACLDEITMRDGSSYTGYIVEQSPRGNTKILSRQGNITVLEASQISSSRKIAAKPDEDLWEIRPYTNTVMLRDGSSRTGFIINQSMGADAASNFIEVLNEYGKRERVNFSDISEYRCSLRAQQEQTEGSVLVNEQPLQKKTASKYQSYIFTSDTTATVMPAGLPLSVSTRLGSPEQDLVLMKVTRLRKEQSVVLGYNTTDASAVQPVSTQNDTARQIATANYGTLTPGRYALVDKAAKTMFLIQIIDNKSYFTNY